MEYELLAVAIVAERWLMDRNRPREAEDYIMYGKANDKGGQGVPDSLMSSGIG